MVNAEREEEKGRKGEKYKEMLQKKERKLKGEGRL